MRTLIQMNVLVCRSECACSPNFPADRRVPVESGDPGPTAFLATNPGEHVANDPDGRVTNDPIDV